MLLLAAENQRQLISKLQSEHNISSKQEREISTLTNKMKAQKTKILKLESSCHSCNKSNEQLTMQNQQLQLHIHGISATVAAQARAHKQQFWTQLCMHEQQLQSLHVEKETAETTA